MINDEEYIRYNYIEKNLLRIVKIAQFKSKEQLQRAKLVTTLKINNKDITKKLRKVVSKNNFIVEFIKQLETGLIKGFVVIKNLLTF